MICIRGFCMDTKTRRRKLIKRRKLMRQQRARLQARTVKRCKSISQFPRAVFVKQWGRGTVTGKQRKLLSGTVVYQIKRQSGDKVMMRWLPEVQISSLGSSLGGENG